MANDAFAVGCSIAFICSNGKHPFQSTVFPSIPDNIVANRRARLTTLQILNPLHEELVTHLTAADAAERWTIAHAASQSRFMTAGSAG